MLISGQEQSSANDFIAGPAFRWSMLFVGLAIGFLGMDIMVRRPMIRELARVRSEVSTVEQDMEELVGVKNQVWETNNLLTSLKSQYRQLEDARLSVTAMEQLRKEVDAESEKTDGAFAKFDRMVALQNSVLKNTRNVDVAQNNLDRLVTMQDQVVLAGQRTKQAEESVSGLLRVREAALVEAADIDSAMAAVREFGSLKDRIVSESEGLHVAASDLEATFVNVQELIDLKDQILHDGGEIDVARDEVDAAFASVREFGALRDQILKSGEGLDVAQTHVTEFTALKNDIFNEAANVADARRTAREFFALSSDIRAEADGVIDAQMTAEDLFTLKNDIVENGGNTKTAFSNAERLFSLRNTLNSDMDLDGAAGNLDQLVSIQDTIHKQTREVADAIDTLEVLSDLSEELQGQVVEMGSLRKNLMDIVLMEATVRKVVDVLEPLAEISSLRRMGDAELRDAARVIMDKRRIARQPAGSRRTASESLKLNNIELFTTEKPLDILVPLPKGDDVDSVIDRLEK